jgi:hypothetical protein
MKNEMGISSVWLQVLHALPNTAFVKMGCKSNRHHHRNYSVQFPVSVLSFFTESLGDNFAPRHQL